VEVSSFQLETTDRFHPWISVLVNFSSDHLDRHPTFEAYGAAKARMFANQTSDDWAVVNADDAPSMALARNGRARRFDFALDADVQDGVTVRDGDIVRRDPGASRRSCRCHRFAAGTASVGRRAGGRRHRCVAGVPPAAMRRAVEGFAGLPHALEHVADIGGVSFVNDSKATNIASARRSIESFPAGVVAIMGGKFKGGDFGDLQQPVRAHATGIVAIGEAAPLIETALGAVVPIRRAASMAEAVSTAFAMAKTRRRRGAGPACSSFDMFRDYIDRGDQFRAAVEALEAR
jgi:UDP-N-acetylmuramoylalanine--D-glutamate ligase